MRGVNKVILIGNATRDAELRHTSTGKAVSSIRLATNRTINGHEEAQFHAIVCWDTLAETTSTYVKKGDPLYVEGRLQYRSFQDEEGKERGIAEIVASDVQFLGRRRMGSDDTSTFESSSPSESPTTESDPATAADPRPPLVTRSSRPPRSPYHDTIAPRHDALPVWAPIDHSTKECATCPRNPSRRSKPTPARHIPIWK